MPRIPGYYIGKIRDLAREWGGRCVACGTKAALEFAHLRPTGLTGRGRGRCQRYHDVKNHPESYVLLCRWCHLDFDMGKEIGRLDTR